MKTFSHRSIEILHFLPAGFFKYIAHNFLTIRYLQAESQGIFLHVISICVLVPWSDPILIMFKSFILSSSI